MFYNNNFNFNFNNNKQIFKLFKLYNNRFITNYNNVSPVEVEIEYDFKFSKPIFKTGKTFDKYYDRKKLIGTRFDDVFVRHSDAGEPEIAQEFDGEKVYPDQPYADSIDILKGKGGADTFQFILEIDAKDAIIRKHADELTGEINWQAVAGENDNVHDHWVNSIGKDIIKDFDKNEGDVIEIYGHTVEAQLLHIDTNKDDLLDSSVIELYSNQGGAGAHDGDYLGQIVVKNNLLTEDDYTVDKNVFYGAYDNVSQI